MIWFVTIVVSSVLVCLAQSENLCEKVPTYRGPILISDPKDPHIFHVCLHLRDVGTIECATGTVFSQRQQTCVHEITVEDRCQNYIRSYRSPDNKNKFIVCVQGKAYTFFCPSSLVYDDNLQECVWDN